MLENRRFSWRLAVADNRQQIHKKLGSFGTDERIANRCGTISQSCLTSISGGPKPRLHGVCVQEY
jgi:hypothetical protein